MIKYLVFIIWSWCTTAFGDFKWRTLRHKESVDNTLIAYMQKAAEKERMCVCVYTYIYVWLYYIYVCITDSLCCTAENNDIVSQQYSNKNYFKGYFIKVAG